MVRLPMALKKKRIVGNLDSESFFLLRKEEDGMVQRHSSYSEKKRNK